MIRRLLGIASVFVVVSVIVFVVNQTAQVVALANTFHPLLGRMVLGVLVVVYAACVAVPILLFLRLPRGLDPPRDETSAEYALYLRKLSARLTLNPALDGERIAEDRTTIETAFKTLDAKAEVVIKETASRLFISTAISQNGRLDALMVLVEQSRLIYRLAHLYVQRPSLRDMAKLYANVGTTLFAASQLDDLGIREQIQPVFNAALGHAAISLVPGVAPVASIVLASLLDGTANAFLTLRVGVLCQNYCRPIHVLNRSVIRRNSTVMAASMLGSIVLSSAATVSRAIGESAAAGIRNAGSRLNPFKSATDK